MGVGIWPSSRISNSEMPYNGNPNPYKFNIIAWFNVGTYLIAKIKYPDCSNYEGMKVLLFENLTQIQLLNMTKLDPHFTKNKDEISPIARFEPTDRGMKMAQILAESLMKE